MKVGNIKCELKHWTSSTVICGSYMLGFSYSKDMQSMLRIMGGGNKEDSGTFMSYSNCQEIEN